ncbi:hypothetical protein DEO72_LG8g1913 [Vigna unguiculata]|uniref:Uncharacterized protein n=1 Tax=Vigna unguiculata TaxID=3917 RepID=A0A4D6MSX9_VIGUN|nr:hypothetical protein DEO72_LG8g1913 [Vigna unguiculata]
MSRPLHTCILSEFTISAGWKCFATPMALLAKSLVILHKFLFKEKKTHILARIVSPKVCCYSPVVVLVFAGWRHPRFRASACKERERRNAAQGRRIGVC